MTTFEWVSEAEVEDELLRRGGGVAPQGEVRRAAGVEQRDHRASRHALPHSLRPQWGQIPVNSD